MKFKQVLKFGFHGLLSIKEDYLIAKGGKVNPYTLMRFITAQLIMVNPIIPHFSQYCWKTYVYPILSKSTLGDAKVCENLDAMPWPKISAEHDKVASDRLTYLRDLKGNVITGLDKAKTGGNKKGKKGGGDDQPKVVENCNIFVAMEYPEFKKQCLTIL